MRAQWPQENHTALAAGAPNGSASPMVKPLVDYPDDDDEDAMDTKPENLSGQPAQTQSVDVADAPAENPPGAAATPTSPRVQTPPAPERLAEKRRREEEDEDELVKLATGPKRRSSTSSNSSAGSMNRKKKMSIGSIGTVDKGSMGVLGGVGDGAAPKRIAINLGPTVKSSSDDDTSCADSVSKENNEKENRGNGHDDQAG